MKNKNVQSNQIWNKIDAKMCTSQCKEEKKIIKSRFKIFVQDTFTNFFLTAYKLLTKKVLELISHGEVIIMIWI